MSTEGSDASAASPATPARKRAPTQQRSRERLERILNAASELIAKAGSDQMKMSEVAERAGISIGSLYQYFPDKAAIIRTLAERYALADRQCIADALAQVRDLDDLRRAYIDLIDTHYSMFLAEPVMRDISSGMQADKELMAIELNESRRNSALLADVMARLHPGIPKDKIAATAFLAWQLCEATMRLAISTNRTEGDALVEAFKQMTLREILEP